MVWRGDGVWYGWGLCGAKSDLPLSLIIIISSVSMKAVFFASYPGVNHPGRNPCICSTTLLFIGHLKTAALIRNGIGSFVSVCACVTLSVCGS